MKRYKIKMLPTAKIDLADMIDYLSQFYPNTAIKQYDRIIDKINKIEKSLKDRLGIEKINKI